MASMNVEELIYLCWTEESSTVFKAKFDGELWGLITEETKGIYLCQHPKRPTRLSEGSKVISKKLETYQKNMVTFLCEVPSVKATCKEVSQTHDNTPYVFPVVTKGSRIDSSNDIEMTFRNVIRVLEETYEICRKKATEVVVWLLSDIDRNWNIEVPHSLPVAYAMKGYSLPNKPMRDMHEHILDECRDRGIEVVCSCFDGQWIKLATRDVDDRPLTLLQLQRDVYNMACKVKRTAIVKHLSEKAIISDPEQDLDLEKSENCGLIVSCPLLRKLFESIQFIKKPTAVKTINGSNADSLHCRDTLACLPEEALEVLIDTDDKSRNDKIPDFNEAVEEDDLTVKDKNDVDTIVTSNSVTNSHGTCSHAVSSHILISILNSFQNNEKKAISSRWKGKTLTDLNSCINDVGKLNKLTHAELNIIIDICEKNLISKRSQIRKSFNIFDKSNAISKLIGSGIQKERIVKSLDTLKDAAMKVVQNNMKYAPKSKLNDVYAVRLFDDAHKNWISDSPFEAKTDIEGIGPVKWFSYPEFSKTRQRIEPKCLDAHHLLVNLRVKVCKDGVQGINNKAWHAVAESNRNTISKALVVDLIDKQSNAFALRTFSVDVENEMRRLNFEKEGDFCRLIREWYEAEDESGISALERMKRRLRLKSFLLKDVDFSKYPMFGMYIKGFPRVMYEGFLQRIDTILQLYSFVKNGTFNQRSISSLVNETFFGELSEMEPTKLGCPKAINIPRLMSTVTELHHVRSNPEKRNFKMVTTRKSVYPSVQLSIDEGSTASVSVEENLDLTLSKINSIKLRDHAFDVKARQKKKRVSKRCDISKPNDVSRGCMPIRAHHKCDESKVLPTTRLGIEMSDISK